jgi:hypothetical protein
MKSKIFLFVIGVTLIVLFCAHPGGLRQALAASTDPPRQFEVTHTHKHDNGDDVSWKLKENGKGVFRVAVKIGSVVQWTNTDPNELNMSIIVSNTNDWGGTFKVPKYGLGCATCGQIDTTSGVIQLTFIGNSQTLNNHYQIVIPNPAKDRATTYDYDMVDATVVWTDTFKGNQGKDR